MSDALLEVSDLSISFTQYAGWLRQRVVTPVRGMSLAAHPGRVTALVGASGSGKTLLGLAVLGLLPANASLGGRIDYDGEPLTAQRRGELVGSEMTMLPQSVSHLDPTATVGSQVARALELAGEPPARARAALAERGLEASVLGRYPHELSGGMARRVLAAMALAGRRRLLVADEPTPGLEPALARGALADLRARADDGAAVVLISHDVTGVLGVADTVVVTDHGRTLETAAVSAFHGDGRDLAEPYSRALWRALPENGFVADRGADSDPHGHTGRDPGRAEVPA